MSFVPASFVVFHIEVVFMLTSEQCDTIHGLQLMFTVQERTSAVKHLHFVSGVSPRTYWAAALGWDLSLYRSVPGVSGQ